MSFALTPRGGLRNEGAAASAVHGLGKYKKTREDERGHEGK